LKIIFLLISLATLLFSKHIIRFSYVVSPNTPKGIAVEFFAKRVKELSSGEIEVRSYPNAQLYNDRAVIKALRYNSIQMAAPSFSKFTSIVPQLQIFDLPFLFRDEEHLHTVLDGYVGEHLKSLVEKKGIKALSFWDSGFKQLSSSKGALIEPKDAQGLKFRIMSSKVLESQFESVGASAQVLPFSEVYSALEQGVIDAAENPLSNFYTKKFYEAQSDLTMSNHGYLGSLVVMSKRFYEKLPSNLQDVVVQALNETTTMQRKLVQKMDEEYLQKLQEYAKKSSKLKIHYLNSKQRDEWRKKMSEIYAEFYDVIGEDIIKDSSFK